MNSQWHVITGVPGSGKTTLINMLAELGYAIVPEAAREIFDEELAQGHTLEQIRGEEQAWQKKILTHILEAESKLDQKKLIFFDRGAHDGLAHLRYYGLEPGGYWKPIFDNPKIYKTVFMLDPNPNFEQDNMRTENSDFIKRVTSLMTDVYTEYGMAPIQIPFVPPKERLDLILSHLKLSHE